MKDKNILKKYAILMIGDFIMGIGIGICNYANMGVDPMSVLETGLLNYLPISFGLSNTIVNLVLIFGGYLVEKKNVTLATFLGMLSISFGIDCFGMLKLPQVALPFSFIVLFVGLMLYCLGVALSIVPHAGYTAYDCAIFAGIKLLKKEYHVIRWIVELSYIGLGVVLGGKIGICTVIVFLFSGRIIEIMVKQLEKRIDL